MVFYASISIIIAPNVLLTQVVRAMSLLTVKKALNIVL